MSTNPTPTPPHKLTQLSGKWFRTLYELLHEVHTIKICIHHCNDEIAFVLNTCENAPEKKSGLKSKVKPEILTNRFIPGDLVTRMGEWEMGAVSRRLLDNPGELAYMHYLHICHFYMQHVGNLLLNYFGRKFR